MSRGPIQSTGPMDVLGLSKDIRPNTLHVPCLWKCIQMSATINERYAKCELMESIHEITEKRIGNNEIMNHYDVW